MTSPPEPRLPPHPIQAVDRTRPIHFTFDRGVVAAYQGDTIGSALYAAGIRVFTRSFKYHRRRGLLCVAGRCPNCLMTVNGTPNVRTCTHPVREGDTVRSQHAWPGLKHDALRVLGWLGSLLPVGFYYKTFIHPRILWPFYERVLRRLAAQGRMGQGRESLPTSEHRYLHADVAVVGGGPAGIAAALEAAKQGCDVVLVDDQEELGGHLRWRRTSVEGEPGFQRAETLAALVRSEPRIRHWAAATALGLYEGRLLGVMQASRLTEIRASRVVIATGGFEHLPVFRNNDLPGLFLGEGLLRLMTLYAIRPEGRAVVVAKDERGWGIVSELVASGLAMVAVIDTRGEQSRPPEAAALRKSGVQVLSGYAIREARGRGRVEQVVARRVGTGGPDGDQVLTCELVVMTDGWEPATALLAHAGAKMVYRPERSAFFPAERPDWLFAAGEVNGARHLADIERDGRTAGQQAAGSGTAAPAAPSVAALESSTPPRPTVESGDSKRFICLCEDVTENDLATAIHEGFDHIETLKRYSTVTMGPCQGKMCHFNSLSACAVLTGQTITAVGRTTARPPVHPVSLGVLAGPGWEPVRRTPMHRQHETAGATWMDMGAWKRPAVYTSVEEECRRIHDAVGLIDVTTLGKLDVQGRDAAPFLDWIHSNRIANLAVGRIRYRLMLDDSGVIVDDGTVARLADDHFFVTTGTGSLEQVQEWLEWWLADGRRCVHVTDVTAAYAAINVAGPRSRELLQGISDGDWSNTAVPYLQAARRGVAGVPVIALRIGFLGELGYELHFPAEYGGYLWNTLLEAGGRLGIAPVGIQAQRVLRLEKLHLIPGYDTDSVSNPLDADLAWCVKLDKPDFIGRAALARSDVTTGQRLVGFQMANGAVPEEGAAIVVNGKPVGRVTSAKWSERLNRGIGLAWVPAELGQADSELPIRVDGRIEVGRVLNRPPHDPDGARLRS